LSVSNHVSGSVNIDGSEAVDIEATLTAAAINALLPPGIILMWNGAANEVPEGWALCDGTNTTPDLSGRFIVGVGTRTGGKTYALGNSGGSENAVIVEHNHTGTATSGNATHSHSATSTVTDNGHSHGIPTDVIGSEDIQSLDRTPNSDELSPTDPNAIRTSTNTTGITVSTTIAEANAAHSHTLSIDDYGESSLDKNLPPYYALCYIMKIAAT
jgi:microcystin-dependent protein